MRRERLIPTLLMIALPACASSRHVPPNPLAPEALAGTYELVSIGGSPLPVREFRAVYHGGRLTLYADRRFVSAMDAETCSLENVCTRETSTAEGTWRVLPDGTLSIESASEEEHLPGEEDVPSPRIEADGKEIRYHSPAGGLPNFTYRCRS
jgi:hypothetical protein